MDKQAAIRLLDQTFNNEFNEQQFARFATELFNKFEITKKTWTVWKEYQNYIESYYQLGSYQHNKKTIDVLAVKLKKTSSRDRARTMQRNFIAKYLSNADKDAALVAFYGEDPQDWRFSFVKMEYRLQEVEPGKVKPVKELTPAKRCSFLVGRNEPNYTCKKQFLKLIMEEKINPSLEEIEQAFSIENVTKEFFQEYKELYLMVKESLEKVIQKNPYVKKEFEEKNISTVDFAKKLLGQIVFIYFLQKKGWLGVTKDEKGRFREWGTGPKNFLRKLYDKQIVDYKNFFNDVLEPLFYEALATERDDDYYSRFNCKIPFLNGGLFEPINDYDWAGTEIVLDNTIFDKILSTFDRFNFTVKEDEPLEKEVAIDPEMLGKVFENLLEVKDRKSKGSFYTPREIVHYMCQQSLINYLETNTGIPRKDLEKFIQLGDFALDQIIKEQEQLKKYGKTYDISEKHSLPKTIKENHARIEQLLKEIKIVDPAVGSGAFPVGMMNEIVKARSILALVSGEEKSIYDLKRETIENCLYGVDIDSSAVDIAKLRFWLSLIVDELDMKNIKPLPNLDHKIMCGNSLLEEFEGIKLFDERLLGKTEDHSFEIEQVNKKIKNLYLELGQIHTGKKKEEGRIKEIQREIKKLKKRLAELKEGPKEESKQQTLSDALNKRIKESQRKLAELRKLQKEFFNEQNRKRKKEQAEQINKLEWELIEETLKEQEKEEAIKKLEQYKKNKSKPFFLWKLYFSEVFQRKNPGFDVVIANPPYVDSETMVKEEKRVRENYAALFKSAKGNWDLFVIFIEEGLYLLRNKGVISYIVPNKFISATYTETLRKILSEYKMCEIRDYSHLNVFKEASVYPIIYVLEKSNNKKEVKMTMMESLTKQKYTNVISPEIFYGDINWARYFVENETILNLLLKISKYCSVSRFFPKISGAATVSEAYEIKKFIKEAGKYSKYKKLVNTGTIDQYVNLWGKKKTRYIKSSFNKPIILDKDLKKFSLNRYVQSKSEKIIVAGMTKKLECVLDKGECYAAKSTTIILPGEKDLRFLLAILNSKLISFWYQLFFKSLSLAGGFIRIGGHELAKVPLVDATPGAEKKLVKLVDQILAITKSPDYFDNCAKQAKVKKLEAEIDKLVYKLYDLTPEEIKIVEELTQN